MVSCFKQKFARGKKNCGCIYLCEKIYYNPMKNVFWQDKNKEIEYFYILIIIDCVLCYLLCCHIVYYATYV